MDHLWLVRVARGKNSCYYAASARWSEKGWQHVGGRSELRRWYPLYQRSWWHRYDLWLLYDHCWWCGLHCLDRKEKRIIVSGRWLALRCMDCLYAQDSQCPILAITSFQIPSEAAVMAAWIQKVNDDKNADGRPIAVTQGFNMDLSADEFTDKPPSSQNKLPGMSPLMLKYSYKTKTGHSWVTVGSKRTICGQLLENLKDHTVMHTGFGESTMFLYLIAFCGWCTLADAEESK